MKISSGLAAYSALLLALATEAGETVPLKSVSHIHGIAADSRGAAPLSLGTHHGLYRANPDGTAERISNHRDDLMGFTPHPAQPDTFLAGGHPARGGNLGFIVSTDGGASWRRLSPGLGG